MNMKQMLDTLDTAGETYTWSSSHARGVHTLTIDVENHPSVMASITLRADGTWEFSGATGMNAVESVACRELLGELLCHIKSVSPVGVMPSCAARAATFLAGGQDE